MSQGRDTKKRRVLVETAYELFKAHGFHATGIDKIIEEADVAKMTMYRHFPAKEGLIVEVLNWRAGRFARQLNRLTGREKTAKAKIVAIFDWYGRWFDAPDFHGCLFAHAIAEFGGADNEVFRAATRQKEDLRDYMRNILAEDMPDSEAGDTATTLLLLI